MKKIITTAVILVFTTISANAIDMSRFSALSLTGGFATNQGVFGGSATQKNFDDTPGAGALKTTKKEHGVFTDGYTSQFIELGLGQWISIGYEHTPDSITTPTNKAREGIAATESTVSVDFNDLNTTYIKINTPVGIYLRYGEVETDLDIKEVMSSGSTYANKSTNGEVMAVGYQKLMGETGFGFRIEGSYMTLDAVKTDNGITVASGSVANGGRNEVDASNLEGLTAKAAITYTFGRN